MARFHPSIRRCHAASPPVISRSNARVNAIHQLAFVTNAHNAATSYIRWRYGPSRAACCYPACGASGVMVLRSCCVIRRYHPVASEPCRRCGEGAGEHASVGRSGMLSRCLAVWSVPAASARGGAAERNQREADRDAHGRPPAQRPGVARHSSVVGPPHQYVSPRGQW